jgi:hypothetical protein
LERREGTHQRTREAARVALDRTACEAAWAAGTAWGLADAIEHALASATVKAPVATA